MRKLRLLKQIKPELAQLTAVIFVQQLIIMVGFNLGVSPFLLMPVCFLIGAALLIVKYK